MIRTAFLACVAFVMLMANCRGTDTPAAFDKQAFEAYTRYLLLWGPEVKVEIDDPKPSAIPGLDEVRVRGSVGSAVQGETFFMAKDGHTFVHGSLFDMTRNPFELVRSKLRTEDQPSFGPAAASVVIVVFSDFECPYCKMESTVLRSDLVKTYPDQVRVVFKDLPIARVHPWATRAAIIGRCVFHQKASLFWIYHDWVFEHQSDLSLDNLQGKVIASLKESGLNEVDLDSCIKTKEPQEEINRSMDEAVDLGVTGTPVLFVNGRMMLGAAWPTLKQAIETELDHQKKAKADLLDCGCGLPDTTRASMLLAGPR